MVSVVSAVSGAQTSSLKANVQSGTVVSSSEAAVVAPATSDSSIDYVTSGIYVNNLQNVAILEYRSSQTGDIIQQYPDEAQINAFKAAQQLADAAKVQQQEEAAQKAAAESVATTQATGSGTAAHITAATSVPEQTSGSAEATSGSAGGHASSGSSGASSTSIIA